MLTFEIINPNMPIEGFQAVRIKCRVLRRVPDDFRELGERAARRLITAIQAGRFEGDLMRLVEPSVD